MTAVGGARSVSPSRILLALAALLAVREAAVGQAASSATPSSAGAATTTQAAAGTGAATVAAGATGTKPLVLGFARLSADGGLRPELTPLLTVLPRLVIAELGVLPPRLAPPETALEAAELAALRARFAAGAEFAKKLDDRAVAFLDPAIRPERRARELSDADAKLSAAEKKLALALDASRAAPAGDGGKETPTALWEGHGKGDLLESSSASGASLAKSKSLDFLVYGSVEESSGYASVSIRGYDASLDRAAFEAYGHCAPDDPGPLAVELARKIELWVAGRDFARVALDVRPRSATVSVDDRVLGEDERVLFRFSDGRSSLRASASGYLPSTRQIDFRVGDRSSLDVELKEASTGKAVVQSDPEGAEISIDSMPSGAAPVEVALNGRRLIATARAPGREDALSVLPRGGEQSVSIALRPTDGLGPGGRFKKGKDDFYAALGWFVLSVPVTAVSAGAQNGYYEAAVRSSLESKLVSGYNASTVVFGIAATATAIAAGNAIFRLVKYLASTR